MAGDVVNGGDKTVAVARAAAAGLAVADALFAVQLHRRSHLTERFFGPGGGAWHEWGVGTVAAYAAFQAVVAVQADQRSLRGLGLLRVMVVPGHVSRLLVGRSPGRWTSAPFLAGNLGVAAVCFAAARSVGATSRPANDPS